MSTSELALPDDYPRLLAELKAQIRSAQWTAARAVNTALIELYWAIGKAILDRQSAVGWGTRVIDRLSDDLRAAYPDMSGLWRSNIHYMRQMAAAWPESAVVPQAVGQLPWGHVRVLLGKLDEPDAMNWYAQAATEGGLAPQRAPEPDQGQGARESRCRAVQLRAHTARSRSSPASSGFYIAAVDDRLRDRARHASTVGILMCADRNDTVVRYALSGAARPMAVAGYLRRAASCRAGRAAQRHSGLAKVLASSVS